jgi:hypothetical protein
MGTWDRLHKPVDIFKQLAEISNREERERFRREWGLVGLDGHGRPGYVPIYGSGYQSAINQGVVGSDPESYFGDDKQALKAYRARRKKIEREWDCLNGESVRRLYEALSYLNLVYRLVMNTQIVIAYELLGITDHEEAALLLSDFHREAAAWFRRRKEHPYFHVYVHENARDRGFHTHLMTRVPLWCRPQFKSW